MLWSYRSALACARTGRGLGGTTPAICRAWTTCPRLSRLRAHCQTFTSGCRHGRRSSIATGWPLTGAIRRTSPFAYLLWRRLANGRWRPDVSLARSRLARLRQAAHTVAPQACRRLRRNAGTVGHAGTHLSNGSTTTHIPRKRQASLSAPQESELSICLKSTGARTAIGSALVTFI